jgi:hypothetical protein
VHVAPERSNPAPGQPGVGRRGLLFRLRSPRATPLLLALACLAVYNANGRLIASGDTLPARLIPFSILLDGTVTLDRFFGERVGGAERLARAPAAERMRYYYLAPRHGRLYSTYPITLPVLVTPLYAPVVWAKGHWSTDEARLAAAVLEKLTASLVAALSVAAMYVLLGALTDRRLALVLSAAFAFGTSAWTTSSQALWQHGAGVLFILLALAVLARRPGSLALAGLFAGLAVAVRPGNVFFWLALLLVHGRVYRRPRDTAVLALPGVLVGGMVAAYNWVVFANLLGGYGRVHDAFGGALAQGLAGLLVSPSRGLLVYTPFLLAGFAGLWMVCRDPGLRRSPVYATAALFLVCELVFLGWWQEWWGGWSYGPRLLTEAAAGLVVLAVPAAERLRTRPWARRGFAVAVAWSVGVQALGAAAYGTPDGWDATPVSVDQRPERLWDWRDAQIPRTAAILVHGGAGTDFRRARQVPSERIFHTTPRHANPLTREHGRQAERSAADSRAVEALTATIRSGRTATESTDRLPHPVDGLNRRRRS